MKSTERPRLEWSTSVFQASALVCGQTGCSPTAALLLIEDHAESTCRSIAEVAEAVLDHSLTFGS